MSMKLTHVSKVSLALALAGFTAVSEGCSATSSLCSDICDCEHCNDYDEDLVCVELETSANVAAAYECDDAWDAYVTCTQDKGRCEEDDANFTTRAPGSCSGKEAVGLSCTSSSDCTFGAGTTCEGGQCMQRVCADGGECETDADCAGEDLCQAQEDKLDECVDAASAHNGFDLDF
jgi:hypothetical protein